MQTGGKEIEMANINESGNGVGFLGLLAIVFITLKLVKTIDWPWIWVVSPVWIPLAIGLTSCLVYVVYKLIELRRSGNNSEG
jgi:hypothetical protein